MNTALFSAALSEVDDRYLEAALREHPKGSAYTWGKWGAIAACLCLIAVAAFALPRSMPIEPEAPSVIDTPQQLELFYNDVEEGVFSTTGGLCIYGEDLSAEQLADFSPDAPWMQPEYGVALRYGSGELESVCLSFPGTRLDGRGRLEVYFRDKEKPVHSDIELTPDTVTVTRFGDLEATAYQWVDEDRTCALLFVDFTRQGVLYTVHANIDFEDMEAAKADIADLTQYYAAAHVPDIGL